MTENVTELPPPSTPQFTEPEFNQADFVVQDLTEQVAQQAKMIAILKANNAQLTGILKANASLLGLQVGPDGNLSPISQDIPQNRATRRASTPRKKAGTRNG